MWRVGLQGILVRHVTARVFGLSEMRRDAQCGQVRSLLRRYVMSEATQEELNSTWRISRWLSDF